MFFLLQGWYDKAIVVFIINKASRQGHMDASGRMGQAYLMRIFKILISLAIPFSFDQHHPLSKLEFMVFLLCSSIAFPKWPLFIFSIGNHNVFLGMRHTFSFALFFRILFVAKSRAHMYTLMCYHLPVLCTIGPTQKVI